MKTLSGTSSIADNTAQQPAETEHWIIRRARTMEIIPIYPLERTLDNLFIGAMQEIGLHPDWYSMEHVCDLVRAYNDAVKIAHSRTAEKLA